jgi:hypothetical protein
MTYISNEERRVLILTGASRGIGHATVKRFSSAGWRVISCSRHPFPEDCSWEAGAQDHIQVDLADPDAIRAIEEMKDRLKAQRGRRTRSSTMPPPSPRKARGAVGSVPSTPGWKIGKSLRSPLGEDCRSWCRGGAQLRYKVGTVRPMGHDRARLGEVRAAN